MCILSPELVPRQTAGSSLWGKPHECVSAVVCQTPMEEEGTKDDGFLSAPLSSQGSVILDPFSKTGKARLKTVSEVLTHPEARQIPDQDTEMP